VGAAALLSKRVNRGHESTKFAVMSNSSRMIDRQNVGRKRNVRRLHLTWTAALRRVDDTKIWLSAFRRRLAPRWSRFFLDSRNKCTALLWPPADNSTIHLTSVWSSL